MWRRQADIAKEVIVPGQRPPHVKPPAHLSKSLPLPSAGEQKLKSAESGGPRGLEPTRYGDWEKKGICWDF
jgi:hypothetical protein